MGFKPERLSSWAGEGETYFGRKEWWLLLEKGIQLVAGDVALGLQRKAENRKDKGGKWGHGQWEKRKQSDKQLARNYAKHLAYVC